MENTLNDMTGLKIGKLSILGRNPENSRSGNARWNCRCDCGNETVVIGSKLRSGHTVSCGCERLSLIAQGHSKSRLYRIWRGMKNRCENNNDHRYKWYGAKGIDICNEWQRFISFRDWALSTGYQDNLSIDRINVNLGYSPDNCRWATQKCQSNNTSGNRIVHFKGEKYTAMEFAEEFDLSYHTVINRLNLDWSPEKIINTPEANRHQNAR